MSALTSVERARAFVMIGSRAESRKLVGSTATTPEFPAATARESMVTGSPTADEAARAEEPDRSAGSSSSLSRTGDSRGCGVILRRPAKTTSKPTIQANTTQGRGPLSILLVPTCVASRRAEPAGEPATTRSDRDDTAVAARMSACVVRRDWASAAIARSAERPGQFCRASACRAATGISL